MKTIQERDLRFHAEIMELALLQAKEALAAGEFPVGCVIVSQGDVVATGQRTNSRTTTNELDHAEIVALRALYEKQPAFDPALVTVYSTMEPCLMCFSTLIVNGIRSFVYAYEDAMGGGTNLPLKHLAPLYRDLQLEIITGVLRSESLGLFKDFFGRGKNGYLADTYLARYTLSQD